jgi:hypothetical protein
MRLGLMGLLVVGACGVAGAASLLRSAPEPKAPGRVTVTVAPAAAGSIQATVRFTLAGGPDSVFVAWSGGGSGPVEHRLGPVTRDSQVYAAPAPLATSTGQVCVRAARRGLVSVSVCRVWSFTAADVAPPPPAIDTVTVDTALVVTGARIVPRQVTLLARQSLAFCMLFRLGDGAVAVQTEQLPDCAPATAGQPAATPRQQAVVDALCVLWDAEGGTITPSRCDTRRVL